MKSNNIYELSYTESITIDKYTIELRLVFAGELYTVNNVVSIDPFNKCQINLREYIRNKCLYELYKQAPECSHKFLAEQSKILFPPADCHEK